MNKSISGACFVSCKKRIRTALPDDAFCTLLKTLLPFQRKKVYNQAVKWYNKPTMSHSGRMAFFTINRRIFLRCHPLSLFTQYSNHKKEAYS